MLFLLCVLITLLGARGETDCDRPPECSRTLDFQVKLLKLEAALENIRDGLPPNNFFQENCDFLIEFLRCYQQGCGLRHVVVDLDAVVNATTEFCDEESAIRKAYVTHFDCFNSIELTEDTCISSALRTMEVSTFNYEIRASLEKNSVDRLCLFFYLTMSCVFDVVTERCGREAGRAAADILNRAMEIVLCNPDGTDFFASVREFAEAVATENSNQCNVSSSCSGEDEVMDIFEAQKDFPSEQDLQRHCGTVQEALRCPAQIARECSESGYNGKAEAYYGLLEVVNDLCEEGSSFRTSYLRSVSCYNSVLDKFGTCLNDIKQDVNRFMISEDYSPLPFGTKAPLKYTCMVIDLALNCQIREVAATCGPVAAETIGRVLLSLQKLSLNMNCRNTYMAVWRGEYFDYLMKIPEEC